MMVSLLMIGPSPELSGWGVMAFVTRRSGEREIRSRMDGDGSGDEAATRLSAEWKEVAEIHAAKKADLQR